MAKTRMAPNPDYKKVLIRLPLDLLDTLKSRSQGQDRSVNGEIVHILREACLPKPLSRQKGASSP